MSKFDVIFNRLKIFMDSDDGAAVKEVQLWADKANKLLKEFTFPGIGVKLKDISIESVAEWGCDIVGTLVKDHVTIKVYFCLRDVRRVKDAGPKWELEVSLEGITPKKGFFNIKMSGGNATPEKGIAALAKIFTEHRLY